MHCLAGVCSPCAVVCEVLTHVCSQLPVTTGVKQNYARKHKIPIDAITFNFTCLPDRASQGGTAVAAAQGPEDGAIVHGMFVEGARWDGKAGLLAESHPKVSQPGCCSRLF